MFALVVASVLALTRALRRGVAAIGAATERWRGPVAFGLAAAAALWTVWYFTKAPCTMAAATAGQCHPGVLADYINHQIMGQCLLVGMAAATLKGGYNEIMLNRERKRADAAEERLAEERKRNDERLAEERKRNDERLAEERKRVDALLEGFHAERIQSQAAQQVMLDTITQMSTTLTQLLERSQNGSAPSES